jgi:hypothetical protein
LSYSQRAEFSIVNGPEVLAIAKGASSMGSAAKDTDVDDFGSRP